MELTPEELRLACEQLTLTDRPRLLTKPNRLLPPGGIACAVYEATSAQHGLVAVKFKLPPSAEQRDRTAVEAIIAKTAHGIDPRSVGPLDAQWLPGDRDLFAIVFPRLAQSVRAALLNGQKDGSLTLDAVSTQMVGVACCLHHWHEARLMWRDAKPPNLMDHCGLWCPIDFSVARMGDAEGPRGRSRDFAPPHGGEGPAADQFSLGLTYLYYLLLREEDKTINRIRRLRERGLNEERIQDLLLSYECYFAHDRRVLDLGRVLARMLHDRPQDRFPSMAEAAAAIRAAVPRAVPMRERLATMLSMLPL